MFESISAGDLHNMTNEELVKRDMGHECNATGSIDLRLRLGHFRETEDTTEELGNSLTTLAEKIKAAVETIASDHFHWNAKGQVVSDDQDGRHRRLVYVRLDLS